MIAIVLGWGLALIPLGFGIPLWAGLAALFAGGVIFGPWLSLSMATFQDAVPPTALSQLLAVLGGSGTLFASGLATMALAVILIDAALVAGAIRSHRRG
jgi:hypothetical protein